MSTVTSNPPEALIGASNAVSESAPHGHGDPERRWLAEVYKPGARQLTARAAIMGMLLGGVLCLSNLYVVLKTGWSLGVTITACIMGFAIFGALRSLRLIKTEFSMLENNALGS